MTRVQYKACIQLSNKNEGCLHMACKNGGVCTLDAATCSTVCFCSYQFSGTFCETVKETLSLAGHHKYGCAHLGLIPFAAACVLLASIVTTIAWLIYVSVSSSPKSTLLTCAHNTKPSAPDVHLKSAQWKTSADESVEKPIRKWIEPRFRDHKSRKMRFPGRYKLSKKRFTYHKRVPVLVEPRAGYQWRNSLSSRIDATDLQLELNATESIINLSHESSSDTYASYATSSNFNVMAVIHIPEQQNFDKQQNQWYPLWTSMSEENEDYEDNYATLIDYTISVTQAHQRMSYEPTRRGNSYANYNDEDSNVTASCDCIDAIEGSLSQ